MAVKRLNIGCGGVVPTDWVNADAVPVEEGVIQAELGLPLPWADSAFEYIACHHVLQHVTYARLVRALAELRRVLEPDGVLRLSVPSLLGAVRAHARGDIDWFPRIVGDETTLDGRFCSFVTWYSTARSVFTPSWLVELCGRADFDLATPAQYEFSPLGGGRHADICALDSRAHESIYVEARR